MVVMRRNARLRRGVPCFGSPAHQERVSDGQTLFNASDLRFRCKFNGPQQPAFESELSTPQTNIPWLKVPFLARFFRGSLALHVAEPSSWTFSEAEMRRRRESVREDTRRFAQIRGRLALAVLLSLPYLTVRRWAISTKSYRSDGLRRLSSTKLLGCGKDCFPLDHSAVLVSSPLGGATLVGNWWRERCGSG